MTDTFDSGLTFAQGRNLWAVKPTGRYAIDCEVGARAADELISRVQADRSPVLATYVQRAIAECGRWSGVEAGFAERMAVRAMG